MPIRTVVLKKLPKGEQYVVPLSKLKCQFLGEPEVGLFMTNDRFSFDRACRKRPKVEGTVALVASYSFNYESRYLHLYKIKDSIFSDKLEKSFSVKVLHEVEEWFKTIETRLDLLTHNSLIYSVLEDQCHVYEVSWNP